MKTILNLNNYILNVEEMTGCLYVEMLRCTGFDYDISNFYISQSDLFNLIVMIENEEYDALDNIHDVVYRAKTILTYDDILDLIGE